MKRLLILLALTAACTVTAKPPTPPLPIPLSGSLVFDVNACLDATCAQPVPNATVQVQQLDGSYLTQTVNAAGYTAFTVPKTLTFTRVLITADGYQPLTVESFQPAVCSSLTVPQPCHNIEVLQSLHVDPSTFSLQRLAAIRGAMWTARLNVPFGPRPNQDDNILAMAFYELYDAPTRARMLAHYHDDLGFTHAVTGPVTGNDCYHGMYPCRQSIPTQAEWDAYLDTIQEWWDKGVIPVYFAKPDGWEVASMASDLDALDALYMQPRAQRLLRVVIYPGWEPSGSKYGWPNATYVAMLQRGARVFPNALRGLHTVADLDAPVGGNDEQVFAGADLKAAAWLAVEPYIHFWAVQVGGYVDGDNPSPIPSPAFLTEFAKLWPDYKRRFYPGGGWYGQTAWNDGQPLRLIDAEDASFGDFWRNWPESTAFDIGDLAMQSGSDGFLDGGRVAVPVR
jgi:hypothetical protein